MPDKESFEAQAEALVRLAKAHRHELSAVDQKHVFNAIRNIEQLAHLRRAIMDVAGNGSTDAPEAMVMQMVRLLHLPVES